MEESKYYSVKKGKEDDSWPASRPLTLDPWDGGGWSN